MNRAVKILLGIAAVLMLAGSVLFVAVMAEAGWDFKALGGANYETRTVEIGEDFENISIRCETADILFRLSEDGTCRLDLYEGPKLRHTVSVENGTLVVGTEDTRKWYEHIGLFFDVPKITVSLPAREYGALLVDQHTGDVTVPADFSFARVEITASTGDVSCAASASDRIRIGTSTGDIRVKGVSAGALELSVSTGRVEVSSVSCGGEVSVRVSTGRTSLTDLTCVSLSSSGSTGDLRLKNVIAQETITVTRSTGDVKFEDCDAAELAVTTRTGDVTGTLRTDKIFFTQTDTGSVKVPESTAGGKCRITTTTGDIRISIG